MVMRRRQWASCLIVCLALTTLYFIITGKRRGFATSGKYLFISENQRSYWADPRGTLLERISVYQHELSIIRKSILENLSCRRPNTQVFYSKDKLHAILGYKDNYIEQVSSRPEIQTLYLKWAGYNMNKMWDSREDSANVLIQNYHQWTASEPLCTWFKTNTTKGKFHIVFNYTCETIVENTKVNKSLDTSVLYGKPVMKSPPRFFPGSRQLASWKFTQTPEFVTYVHMITDAVVDRYGKVYAKNMFLVQDTCSIIEEIDLGLDRHSEQFVFEEVITIHQNYGNSFYHQVLECAPKIVPYLQFLQQHENIMIFFPRLDDATLNLLDIFNISDDRVINLEHGETFSARLVYVPRSTPCGFPLVQETQLLSLLTRDHIQRKLRPGRRNRLIIIQRSWERRFLHHIAIADMLQQVATDYGLEYSVWLDHPVPSFLSGMKMFYEAVMVVAPHGGGGSNLLFSQPGTYVVEAVPTAECLNIWAMCFQRASYILGHHYHGIPSKDGCEEYLDVSADDVRNVVLKLLDVWKSK